MPRMLIKGREMAQTCLKSCVSHSGRHCLSMKRHRTCTLAALHITLARVLAGGLGLSHSSGTHAIQPGHTRHAPGATVAVTFMTTKSGLLPGSTCMCVCVSVCARTHTYHTPSTLAQLAAEDLHCTAGTRPVTYILLQAGSE